MTVGETLRMTFFVLQAPDSVINIILYKNLTSVHNNGRGDSMKLYNAKKRKRDTKERVGFYTALSICLAAVGMAAYSTYTNLSSSPTAAETASTVAVDRIVTGVTETDAAEKKETTAETTEKPTTKPTEPETTESQYVDETAPSVTKSALETMLNVDTSLVYPLDKVKIVKEYSEDTVYNQTLSQWEAHTGVDFGCKDGDKVYAMGDGEVVKVYDDDFMGKTLVVKSTTYTSYYYGMKDVNVNRGDNVKKGDAIATAGTVPSESMDDNHIHVEVKVGGQYVDPLELIDSEE